jgi:hypothetical protein
MGIEVMINLDSGCFLPREEIDDKLNKREAGKAAYSCLVGYFQNEGDEVPDIRLLVDGDEVNVAKPLKLGCENCTYEVRHTRADGTAKRDGVVWAPTFHKHLLHMKDLYGYDISRVRNKFDCVFLFETGYFQPSMVKNRAFKEARKQSDGSFAPTGKRTERQAIAHNVIIHITLEDGEVLELLKNGASFLSTKDLEIKNRLEIEVPTDNSVGNKFYGSAFQSEQDVYWLPNECDPPPGCQQPPCGDDPLFP